MNKSIKLSLLLLFLYAATGFAQISEGGRPYSFSYKMQSNLPLYTINALNIQELLLEDLQMQKQGEPLRMGVVLPLGIDLLKQGYWEKNGNGTLSCRYKIRAEKACALALYYSKFKLSDHAKLFIYSEDHSFLIGAFTQRNNPVNNFFATEFIPGESLILELEVPENERNESEIYISECSYAYRPEGFPSKQKGFGGSGSCEVNINCSEGDLWQDQKASVVRILIKIDGFTTWCSGSLINNTRKDYTPYILTADHCGKTATATELSQWIFYFNYEGPTCDNPSGEGNINTQTCVGAIKRAQGGNSGDTGSDFYLVELNDLVPESYNPFFIGWDRSDSKSPSGISIHHPQGDIKKISTYTSPLDTSDWYGSAIYSHWKVLWTQTANGYGVTEGGSSGSGIYNSQGYLIGTLTGGESSCSNLTGLDFYGKFSYSWNKNGSTPDTHLKEWLDPDNLDPILLKGISYSKIDFFANRTKIMSGERINFTNESLGSYSYAWKFYGATPDTSNEINPQNILYSQSGNYDVELHAYNSDTSFIRKKYSYIQVTDIYKVSYDAILKTLTLDFGNTIPQYVNFNIYNLTGMRIYSESNLKPFSIYYQTQRLNFATGIYCIEIKTNTTSFTSKFIVVH